MPVQVIYRYTCPTTGSVVDCEDLGSHPDGWFTLNGDSYAPAGARGYRAADRTWDHRTVRTDSAYGDGGG